MIAMFPWNSLVNSQGQIIVKKKGEDGISKLQYRREVTRDEEYRMKCELEDYFRICEQSISACKERSAMLHSYLRDKG